MTCGALSLYVPYVPYVLLHNAVAEKSHCVLNTMKL